MYKYFLALLVLVSIPLLTYGQAMDSGSMEAKYKAMYNDVLNALTSGKTDGLDKYVSADFIEHDPSPVMSTKTGLARIKDDFAEYHKVFPDMKAKVHSVAVDGDYLFAYLTFTGTTSEPYMGMPAGHQMTMNAVDVIRFKGDKAAEHWGFTANSDIMNMMPKDKKMDKMMDHN